MKSDNTAMANYHKHGQLAHFSLNVDEIDRAQAFYAAVFGWDFEPWGPPGFFMISLPEGPHQSLLASIQQRRTLVSEVRANGPECTFAVDDIDTAIRAIVENGGVIVLNKSTIPTVGHLVFFQDPEGNILGAMQYDSDAN